MHEYGLAMEIIRIAEKHRPDDNAAKEIVLVIGKASGCSAESLNLYFDLLAAGSICENAQLKIKTITPQLRCEICGAFFERLPFSFECPTCKGQGRPTEIGREFYVESIDYAD